mmetsp:Transcript_12957/g.20069  ORF Transcript_12957/g.20069 Transcript_12957/m.20069 type:complete len:267 (-) Transcript_12957:955-1755(-)|eukprot:CAMPEP_0170496762 /NCGR_PEP_ID=MMETSP0208-20121228/22611_1 /TAXON_ID=197538 /ORGANISM="Strombidium inclinatum, Strain S3" /LENGTH=266 /DNA_ID=CAMNT_0010773387 /DNA_START=609 /DNA_END=1409 /DNA_ORIENTATION=+
MIILVISAVESVQRQTIEVIELAHSLQIPVIIAINKIDRQEADVEQVLLDLEQEGIVAEMLGGNVPCVPISATELVNIDQLESKISEVAKKQLNLMEDHTMKGQCIVIESNIDEKSGQTTASILVKKGSVKVNQTFVCGLHDGRIRHMKDDNGRMIHTASPGQAIHLSGFKAFPEVGSPLYIVDSLREAQMIVQTLTLRQSQEEAYKLLEKGDTSEEMKKSIGSLTRQEKRRIKGGDKSLLFSRLGIASEEDIDRLKSKYGISKTT